MDRGFIVRMTKRANLRDDRSQTHSQIPYGHQTAFCKASPSGGGLVELVRRENEEEGGEIEGKKEVCQISIPGSTTILSRSPQEKLLMNILAHFVGWHSTMLDREVPAHLSITLHPEKQIAALLPF